MSVTKRIASEIYDKDYFLSHYLEGYEEFKAGALSATKKKQLQMLDLEPGIHIAEIGYGRGELLLHCAKKGAVVSGIDYSKDAYAITRETLKDVPDADIRIASCTALPYEDHAFDRVFSGDVIEHLDHGDALLMLREMHRILKPGGFMLLHTTPNAIFTKRVYPLIRPLLMLLHGETVKGIDHHLQEAPKYHIIEYTLFSLRRLAMEAGLGRAKVWIDSDLLRSSEHIYTKAFGGNPVVKLVSALGRFHAVRFFLGNDLYLQYAKA